MMNKGKVLSVSKSGSHSFSKSICEKINLLKGLGVEGDAHMGATVKHRSRVKKDPHQPNLRQVHLIHSELFEEVKAKGYDVSPGQMGENITTIGIDLLNLPKDTVLSIGPTAKIQITGLRNPCSQIDSIEKGLMKEMIEKDNQGNLVRKSGIMAIVLESGEIMAGDEILVTLPAAPYVKLDKV